MRRRWPLTLLVSLLVLTGVLVGVAAAVVAWQLPSREGGRIAGLSAPVSVSLDARGIATVRARSLADALRVEGWLQARERLFQMELARRVAGGEVSELVGAAALPLDRRQRVYGFAQVAEAAVERLPAAERADVQALTDGINAFIASRRGRWGLEFQLLGVEPRPWRPADTIRVLLLMHQQLSDGWKGELVSEALAPLGPARRAFLTPTVTEDDVLVVPDAAPPPRPSTRALLADAAETTPTPAPTPDVAPASAPRGDRPRVEEPLELLGLPLEPAGPGRRAAAIGSNGWAVSGAHTVSGKPLLANDPHLGFGSPGIWYPLRIELVDGTGTVERWVQGVSLPGLPGIVIFQNDRLAVGFTNVGTDVQDTWREPVVGERVERIAVKDAPAESFVVKLGRQGPMVRPGLSLRWAALDPSTLRLPVSAMMLARDWTELNAAADGFLGPAQNVVYADVDGHVGWRATGVLPLRPPDDAGDVPHAEGAPGWSGYLAPGAMPRVVDPPSGRIVTANQRLVGTASGLAWRADWASPVRARRITQLVSGERLDARAMRAAQLDTVGLVHREVVDRLRPVLPPDVAALLAGWDGRADRDGRAFAVAEELRRRAHEAVVAHVLAGQGPRPEDVDWYDSDATLLAALRASPEAWRRAGLGDRDAVLRAAVAGVQATGPVWGELNRLAVEHPFGRGGGLLARVFNPPRAPLSGCSRCVRVATPTFGQSMRFVVDLAHPEETTLVLPLGTSGHLGSPRRESELRRWMDGDLDGTASRLHAPAVGDPLVFVP